MKSEVIDCEKIKQHKTREQSDKSHRSESFTEVNFRKLNTKRNQIKLLWVLLYLELAQQLCKTIKKSTLQVIKWNDQIVIIASK